MGNVCCGESDNDGGLRKSQCKSKTGKLVGIKGVDKSCCIVEQNLCTKEKLADFNPKGDDRKKITEA